MLQAANSSQNWHFLLSPINVTRACSAIARYNQLYISHVEKKARERCMNGLGVTAMQDGCSLDTHDPRISKQKNTRTCPDTGMNTHTHLNTVL